MLLRWEIQLSICSEHREGVTRLYRSPFTTMALSMVLL